VIILTLLAVPIVICYAIASQVKRLTVVIFSLLIFLIVLSGLVKMRASELAVAGATYVNLILGRAHVSLPLIVLTYLVL
jgi:hypothetical protein